MTLPDYDPRQPLHGHTVLVTGAGGHGVGSGVCAALHEAGARLVVTDLTPAAVDTVVRRYPGTVGVACDLRTAAGIRLLFDATARAGGADALVNNAGVGLSKPAHEATDADFEHVFGLDVRALWQISREFVRRRLAAGLGGAIVNVSSVHATATMRRYALYAAAKAAVEGLTRGMAVDLGRAGIRCNAIAPGYVHAEQNTALMATFTRDPDAWIQRHTTVEQPLTRLIEPIDCGRAAAFLISDAARCITGQTLTVDAGLTARLYNHDIQEDLQ